MNGYCIIMLADNKKIEAENIPNKNAYTYLALVDRSKNRDKWWTQNPEHIMVFEKESAAEIQLSKLKYCNQGRVVSHKESVKRITHWFWKERKRGSNFLEELLKEKMQQWHDDDWDEGTNYDGI